MAKRMRAQAWKEARTPPSVEGMASMQAMVLALRASWVKVSSTPVMGKKKGRLADRPGVADMT
jgi:hypothetical protein